MNNVVLFDLDGTLIDSYESVLSAILIKIGDFGTIWAFEIGDFGIFAPIKFGDSGNFT